MKILAAAAIAVALVLAYRIGRDLERMRTEAKFPWDVCGNTKPWWTG
jgi:hypothetical protein